MTTQQARPCFIYMESDVLMCSYVIKQEQLVMQSINPAQNSFESRGFRRHPLPSQDILGAHKYTKIFSSFIPILSVSY
jgi:hypothetical protein